MQYTPLNSGNENRSLLIIDEDEVSNFRYDEVPDAVQAAKCPPAATTVKDPLWS